VGIRQYRVPRDRASDNSLPWLARPIFITSTFRDMHVERSFLRSAVLPAIEERTRHLRVHIEWVDLRVGIPVESDADEAARELHILRVCLDEVGRSRPFIIGLLGERYGWIPSHDQISIISADFSIESDLTGRSVTEIEITHGILKDRDNAKRSLFWFRTSTPAAITRACPGRYDEADEIVRQRLTYLKARIADALPPGQVQSYSPTWDSSHHCPTDLGAWGDTVADAVCAALEAEYGNRARAAPKTREEIEFDKLQDFCSIHRLGFRRREALLDELEQFAVTSESPRQWCQYIIGESGSGKSAVFSMLYSRVSEHCAAPVLLAHATGAGDFAKSLGRMLYRWRDELAAYLKETLSVHFVQDEKYDVTSILNDILRMLSRVSQERRVVIIIDGFDEFSEAEQTQLSMIINILGIENVKIVAFGNSQQFNSLFSEKYGSMTKALRPLTKNEAKEIMTAMFGRYRGRFDASVEVAVFERGDQVSPASWTNPLWLLLAVDQLATLAPWDLEQAEAVRSERGAALVSALMLERAAVLPHDLPGSYKALFDRVARERYLGPVLTSAFLAMLVAGRAGWRESDFRAVLPKISGQSWDPVQFAMLRRLFRSHLRSAGADGRWDFAHSPIRMAASAWLEGKGRSTRSVNLEICDYVLSLDADDNVRATEALHHLAEVGDWRRAAAFFGSANAPSLVIDAVSVQIANLLQSTSRQSVAKGLRIVRQLTRCGEVDAEQQLEICDRILNKVLLPNQSGISAQHHKNISLCCNRILLNLVRLQIYPSRTTILLNISYHSTMKAVLRLKISRPTFFNDKILEIADLKSSLNLSLKYGVGSTVRYIDGSNDCYETSILVRYHCSIAFLELLTGRHVGALEQFKTAINLLEESDRSETKRLNSIDSTFHPIEIRRFCDENGNSSAITLSRDLSYGACFYFSIGQDLLGRKCLSMALQFLTKRSGRFSPWSGVRAEIAYQRRASCIQFCLTQAAHGQQNLAEILKGLETILFLEKKNLADFNSGKASQENYLVNVADSVTLSAYGLIASAKTLLETTIIEIKTEPGHSDYILSIVHVLFGDILEKFGFRQDAIDQYARAKFIMADLLVHEPPSYDCCGVLMCIGGSMQSVNEWSRALSAYRMVAEIMAQLARLAADDTHWKYEMSVVKHHIGDVLCRLGDHVGALAAYREGMDVVKSLATIEPNRPEWQRELSDWSDRVEAFVRFVGALAVRKPLTADSPVARATNLLAAGDVTAARELLDSEPLTPGIANMLAVCDMREGKAAEAATRLQRLVAASDEARARSPPPAAWLRNLSTALLLCGDVKGCQRVLGWLHEPQDTRREWIEAAIEEWQLSFTTAQRFGFRPKPPITLKFEPGEL
jgi:hypothetical protein